MITLITDPICPPLLFLAPLAFVRESSKNEDRHSASDVALSRQSEILITNEKVRIIEVFLEYRVLVLPPWKA